MKRLLLILLFVLITACQAQDVMSYPDTFISSMVNQDNSPSIMLRTSSDRQCFVSDCQAHLVLIHKEAQRVVLETDARGLVWWQVSKDGQRLGLYYLRGRAGRSADAVQTIVEIRSMEDGRVLFSHEYESTGLEAGFEAIVRPLFVFSEDLNFVVRQTYIDYLREISVWDTRTNELVYSRECEFGMFGMFDTELLSPDGKYLLFGCGNEEEPPSEGVSGQMQLIELETGEVLQEIDRYHWSGAVKWDDSSSYFMVTGNGVQIFTLEGELTQLEITGVSALSDFSPDSRFFFINTSSSLSIVNLEDGTSTRISATSIRSRSLGRQEVSADLRHVIIDGETNHFAVINLDTGEIEAQHSIASAEFGYNQYGETWHPDGRYAAFCGETNFVFLWESESDEILNLSAANTGSRGASYCQLAFSSDGRYLAYERHLAPTSEAEYSVSIQVFDLETMESVFETEYLFGEAARTVLEWQRGRNRLFVTNPAESQIEVFEFD